MREHILWKENQSCSNASEIEGTGKSINTDKLVIESCSGLTTIIGYEPWAERAIDSAKQSLADGIPVLIRLHPGADYPCDNKENYYKQDMEGHVVLLVGYDDSTRTFDAVDPWNGDGSSKGLIKLPYEIMPLRCMNATADKASRPTPPEINIDIIYNGDGYGQALKISAGYYLPLGYIIDRHENVLKDLEFVITYKYKGQTHHISHLIAGDFPVDRTAEVHIPLPEFIDGTVVFNVAFSCVVKGERPYPYEDALSMKFKKQVGAFMNITETINLVRFRLVA